MSVLDKAAAADPPLPPPLRRNRNFLLLWLGAGISLLGGRVSGIAYPLLMIWQTGSAVSAGLVGFAGLLPVLLLQLPAGVLVDRWDRRKTMIWCDVVGVLAMGSVGVVVLTGTVTLPHLMAAAFVEGTAAIFYRLSERAAVRNVVHRDHLVSAMSQNEARGRAAGLIGQPLGSFFFALLRWLPFVFAAISHLVALVMLLFIRVEFQTERRAKPRRLRTELAEGVGWLFRQRFLRAVVLLVAGTNVLFQVLSLALFLVVRQSGGSPAVIGVIGAVSGVGGIVGALGGSWFVKRLSPAAIVIGTFTVWTLLMPLVALTANAFLLGAVFAGMTLAGALMNVTAGVYQVQITPDGMQGRVGSVAALLSSGTNSLGALSAGFLLESLGTTPTVLGVGVVMLVITVVAALSPAVRSANRVVAAAGADSPTAA